MSGNIKWRGLLIGFSRCHTFCPFCRRRHSLNCPLVCLSCQRSAPSVYSLLLSLGFANRILLREVRENREEFRKWESDWNVYYSFFSVQLVFSDHGVGGLTLRGKGLGFHVRRGFPVWTKGSNPNAAGVLGQQAASYA